MRARGVWLGAGVLVLVACVGDDPAPVGPADGGVTAGKAIGEACAAGEACASGSCVDGVCCDSPCAGVCEACDVPGRAGQCTPVTGQPRHGACEGDASGACAGSCDGKQGDSCAYPEVECAPGSCAAGVATLAAKCARGTCPAPTTQACALGCFEDGCLGVKQMTAGYSFACAVLTDGKVRCWGDNAYGQIGSVAAGPAQKTPLEVPGLTSVVSVAATFGTACALLADKTVTCWGSNSSGQLGQGAVDTNVHATPAPVPGLTGVTFLAGSSGGTFCAIVDGGAIRCWGGNGVGQVGDGSSGAPKPSPSTVCQPGSTATPCSPAVGATFVAGGDDHTCAVLAGGQVACWGGNGFAQLGRAADNVAHPFPAVIAGLTATHLTGGNRMTCAASGGGAKCWGANGAGRLGNGTNDTAQVTPVSVCTKQDCSTLLTNVTAVSTYDISVCALAGGAVKCWGDNTDGQLGDGNATTSQNFAASTAIAGGAVQVVSGGQTNYAVVVDGANRDVRCWGTDGQGECGDDAPAGTERKTPIGPKW